MPLAASAPFPAAPAVPGARPLLGAHSGVSVAQVAPPASFQLRWLPARAGGSRPGGSRRPLPAEDPRPSVGAPREPPSEPGGGHRCRVSTRSLKATCLRESPGGYPGHHARLAGGEGRLPPTFGPSALSVLLHFQNLRHEQLIDLFDCFGVGFFCASRILSKHALSLLKIEQ